MKPHCARGPLLAAALFFGSVALSSVLAQGTFRNLDFESATVPPLPAGQYGTLYGTQASAAIPYWTADLGPYLGTSPPYGITYNNFTLGSANVSLLGPNWNDSFGIPIIDGNYSVVLQAGDSPGPVSVSIAQTGAVPTGTQSIQMWVHSIHFAYYLGVSLGGQNVPMYVLSQDANNNLLMGGTVSSFAGQTEELRISSLTSPNYHFGSLVVDDIVFSTNPIPEPGVITLLMLGTALFGLTAWRRRT